MTSNKRDDQLVQDILNRLDQSIEDLDPAVTQKLNQARLCAFQSDNRAQNESSLVSHIQQQLQKSEALPTEIENKLNQIRRKAISQDTQSSDSLTDKAQSLYQLICGVNYRLTAGMAATACLTLAVVALFYNSPVPTGTLVLDPDIGLIASADELELYENLDFYLWLAENEVLN